MQGYKNILLSRRKSGKINEKHKNIYPGWIFSENNNLTHTPTNILSELRARQLSHGAWHFPQQDHSGRQPHLGV